MPICYMYSYMSPFMYTLEAVMTAYSPRLFAILNSPPHPSARLEGLSNEKVVGTGQASPPYSLGLRMEGSRSWEEGILEDRVGDVRQNVGHAHQRQDRAPHQDLHTQRQRVV